MTARLAIGSTSHRVGREIKARDLLATVAGSQAKEKETHGPPPGSDIARASQAARPAAHRVNATTTCATILRSAPTMIVCLSEGG